MPDWGFETRQIHSGAVPDPTTGARAVPIYQTTSYTFRDTSARGRAVRARGAREHLHAHHEPHAGGLRGAHRRARGRRGRARSRQWPGRRDGDPVEPGRERRPHRLVGVALRRHVQPVALHAPQARSRDDLHRRSRRPGAWAAAIRPNTKAFFGETLGNPKGDVFDFEGVSEVAHDHNIPLVIDNTLATPYLCQPLSHGTDIVVHSATKFIGGHGTSIGGVIVDGGKFDYEGSGRFPNFTEPDPSYHGLVFGQLPEALFPARFVLKARLQYLRDTGPSVAPLNSFLFLQGLETLSLRMERHVQNAVAVAEWLEARDEVSWVIYPGLASSRWHARQEKYLPKGGGSILSFGIAGGARGGPPLHRRTRTVQPSGQRG